MPALRSTLGRSGRDRLPRRFVFAENQQNSRALTDLIENLGETLTGLLHVRLSLARAVCDCLGAAEGRSRTEWSRHGGGRETDHRGPESPCRQHSRLDELEGTVAVAADHERVDAALTCLVAEVVTERRHHAFGLAIAPSPAAATDCPGATPTGGEDVEEGDSTPNDEGHQPWREACIEDPTAYAGCQP